MTQSESLSKYWFFLFAVAVLSCQQAAVSQDGPDIHVATYAGKTGLHPGGSLPVAVVVALEEGWHVNAHAPGDKYVIATRLEADTPDGLSVAAVDYPDPETISPAFSDEPLLVYGGEFTIGVLIEADAGIAPGRYTISFKLRYQACDDRKCLPPATEEFTFDTEILDQDKTVVAQNPEYLEEISFQEEEREPDRPAIQTVDEAPRAGDDWRSAVDDFEVAASATGYMNVENFLSFLETPGRDQTGFAGKSVWVVLGLVLVGGLLLNLTPCVLPLIPITLGIIGAGAKAGSRSRGFAMGALYGLGLAFVYGVLGLVVILGLSATFGTINSTPLFNAVIAVVFVILGLAMFDVIPIDFSKFQSKLGAAKLRSVGAFALPFAMGCVSALLAGSCVAPVVLSVLVYAQAQYAAGNTTALLLPFLLGVGMALPWPFAGAGLSFLPKPGKWMTRVKQALGVLILAMAVYYGHLAYSLFAQRHFEDAGTTAEKTQSIWVDSLAEGLQKAREEYKPVVIDFWATWCKNCLAMDKTTFKNHDVRAALDNYVPIKYQAENPEAKETAAVLDYFQVKGLPTYVILRPQRE